MGRIERINEIVKAHDTKLFCKRIDGKLCVFRKNWKWVPYEVDGDVYYFMRPDDFFIIAMTSDWRLQSQPVDRGILSITNRLKEIDLWNRDMAQEVIDQEEKWSNMKNKDLKNNNEAFLKDYRRQFARTFNDVNTASMSKKDVRKLKEK